MRSVLNKILAIFVSFTLVFSMTPAVALADSPHGSPGYKSYVAMGTSITGGYGITTTTNWWGWSSVSIPGAFGDKGTSASIIADTYGITNRYNGALLGTRCHEYRVLLEEDFHGDTYTEEVVGVKCGWNEKALKEKSAEYIEALKGADLITLEIGSNDVFSTMKTQIQDKLKKDAQGTQYEEDVNAALDELDQPGYASSIFGIFAIGNMLGEYDEVLELALELKSEAMAAFKTNFDAVIKDIRSINPNADLIVYGVYNPFPYLMECEITNNQNGTSDMREMVLECGVSLGLNEEQTTKLFTKVSDAVIDEQNLYTKSLSSQRSNYTWVNTTGIDMTGSTDGTHPAYAGHAYIAEAGIRAIDSKYVTPCQHLNKVTEGVITPTRLVRGYTGNVLCQDCGDLVSLGKRITYTEYLQQQEVGTIEPEPEDEEVTVTPIPADSYEIEGDYSVLGFTSDIHNQTGDKSSTRLQGWVDSLLRKENPLEFFGSCGDTGNGSTNMASDDYWNLVSKPVSVIENSSIPNWAFTTGNHEHQQGDYANTYNTNDTAKKFTQTGKVTVAENANYRVYAFGATQSSGKFLNEEIDSLKAYLEECEAEDPSMPVIIMSHFPLHNVSGRTIGNIDAVIDLLNNYPNAIFLWGHNHTVANSSETHYDKVLTGDIDGKAINFTYAAAGCMSDTEYSNGSAAVDGKGLVINVEQEDEDRTPEIVMSYTSSTGVVTSSYKVEIGKAGSEEKEPVPALEGSFNKVTSPEAGKKYAIVFSNQALNTVGCSGYTNSTQYSYSGFKGQEVTIGEDSSLSGLYSDCAWEFIDAGANTYYIQNAYTGQYLNDAYSSNDPMGGNIYLSTSKNSSWTFSNGTFKSNNTQKYLAFDEEKDISGKDQGYTGVYDFFTIRSGSDSFQLYEVDASITPLPTEESPLPVASELKDGHRYVISSGNYLMTANANSGYTNNQGYSYSGFDGTAIEKTQDEISNTIYKGMVWECTKNSDGTFYLRNANAEAGTGYLNAFYGEAQIQHQGGELVLGEKNADNAWSVTTSGKLYNTKSKKYLTFDTTAQSNLTEGAANFFTIRSEGNAGKVTFYEVTDKTDVREEEKSELEDCTLASTVVDGKAFAITYGDRALVTSAASGYTNSSNYSYSGLEGKQITINSDVVTLDPASLTSNCLWVFEQKTTNSYLIKNYYTNQYLNASYVSNYTSGQGKLYLTSNKDAADSWTFNGTVLTHVKTGKVLSFETNNGSTSSYVGSMNFFTVRSNSNDIRLYYVDTEANNIANPSNNEMLGSCIAWKQCAIGNGENVLIINGYAIGIEDGKFATRAVDGNTDYSTLSDAYLWTFKPNSAKGTYSLQNVGTGKYIGYFAQDETNKMTVTPYISSAAVEFSSNNNFSVDISYRGLLGSRETRTYYLTCSNGTLSMSYNSMGSTAKFFKQVKGGAHVIASSTTAHSYVYTCSICNKSFERVVTCLEDENIGHNFGEPELVFSSDNKTATATWTCVNNSDHKETLEVATSPVTVAEPTCLNAGSVSYTANVPENAEKDLMGIEKSVTVDLPALGHSFTNDVCTCGTKMERFEFSADGIWMVRLYPATSAGEGSAIYNDHEMAWDATNSCWTLLVANEGAAAYNTLTRDTTATRWDLAAQGSIKGDVNGNGVVNIVDAQVAYDMACGIYSLPEGNSWNMMAMSDVNGNDYLEAADAFAIQRIIHGQA